MNLNKVFLIGNITRDPELRHTQGGTAVCSFSIATNRSYNDAQGRKQTQTEYHNIVAWGKQGETIAQYMRKGSLIMVEGRLQTRQWQDKQGAKHYSTEIIAEGFQFGPRREAPAQQGLNADFEGEIEAAARGETSQEEIDTSQIPL